MLYNYEQSLLDASTKQSLNIHFISFTTGRTEKRNLCTKAAFLLYWPCVNKHSLHIHLNKQAHLWRAVGGATQSHPANKLNQLNFCGNVTSSNKAMRMPLK